MDCNAFELVLDECPEEFDNIKPLCRELRSILFLIKEDTLFTRTPPDPCDFYRPMVNSFNKAIGCIKI